jgi:4'-phosphopantetheinyl transferase
VKGWMNEGAKTPSMRREGTTSDGMAGPPPADTARCDLRSRNEIHLWRWRLDQPNPGMRMSEEIFSRDERQRAQRFHFERDRRRFLEGRRGLRCLLALYLQCSPADVVLAQGEHGKPILGRDAGETSLRFNLSHSDELAVAVVADGDDVGVDIEAVRDMSEDLASHILSDRELAVHRLLPPAARARDIVLTWVRKEAVLKTIGCGLMVSPRRIEFSDSCGERRRGAGMMGEPGKAGEWTVLDFVPATGFVGAVSCARQEWQMRLRDFRTDQQPAL